MTGLILMILDIFLLLLLKLTCKTRQTYHHPNNLFYIELNTVSTSAEPTPNSSGTSSWEARVWQHTAYLRKSGRMRPHHRYPVTNCVNVTVCAKRSLTGTWNDIHFCVEKKGWRPERTPDLVISYSYGFLSTVIEPKSLSESLYIQPARTTSVTVKVNVP